MFIILSKWAFFILVVLFKEENKFCLMDYRSGDQMESIRRQSFLFIKEFGD